MTCHHDSQIGTRQGSRQIDGRDVGAAHVVASLNDNSRDVGQLVGITQQLPLNHEPMIDKVVVLDAGEGQREVWIRELLDVGRVEGQRGRHALPCRPGHRGRTVDVGVVVPQQVVVGGNVVTRKVMPDAAQRLAELVPQLQENLGGTEVVVPVQLPAHAW